MDQQSNKDISFKNIRVTALKEFWGKKYQDSIYLWPGAKHDLRLEEFENTTFETYKNLFPNKDEVNKAYDICVKLYYKYLPLLSKKLNEIHRLNLSNDFWQIALGVWLFRHVCNCYEKYLYLEKLDTNLVSLSLLDKESFYIPETHYDYFFCFSHDFGVQQLVSQYFYLNGSQHPIIKKAYIPPGTHLRPFRRLYSDNLQVLKRLVKYGIYSIYKKRINPQLALLDVAFSAEVVKELVKRSSGRINYLSLPFVTFKKKRNDMAARNNLSDIPAESSFEKYFLATTPYCIPKDYVENFKEYYNSYLKDLQKKAFSHIVCEGWISNIPVAIYVGLAKEDNRSFIVYEHGNGTYFYKNDMDFISLDVADNYLTVGWRRNGTKLVKGGFALRTIRPYEPNPEKKEILYVSRTVPLYDLELIDRNMVNPHFIKELKSIDKFIKLLPDNLRQNFSFRPRKMNGTCWETDYQLDLHNRNVNIDAENFSLSIHRPGIIVIDHISTALAEILLVGTPFILLYDVKSILLTDGLDELLDELINCKIIHLTPESAVRHLSENYDDILGWWQSTRVQRSINKFKELSIAPASGTIDYLLSRI